MTMLHPLALQLPGMGEWIVIAVIGLLFFGKRLPEVGKSLGKGIVEFKKGLKGIEDDVDSAVNEADRPALPRQEPSAALPNDAKFDPYTGKPVEQKAEQKFDPYTGKPLSEEHAGTTVTSGEPTSH